MRRSTKAQIQMAETMAVIIVFLVLLTFGLLWFSKASSGTDTIAEDNFQRLSLLEKTKEIMNAPEFQCSTAGKTDSTCLDLFRIYAFKDLDSDTSVFADRFFGHELELVTLFPPNPDIDPGIDIFSYLPDATPSIGQQKAAIPVILYDPNTETRTFSILVLTQHIYGGTTNAPQP